LLYWGLANKDNAMPNRNVVLTERQQAELVDIRAGITEGLQQAERGEFAEGTIDEVVSRAFARPKNKRRSYDPFV
jgi:predicted transcriptional regulator